MLDGQSVFLTGPPGSGKTYVLNQFIQRVKAMKKRVAITASTGIAATHIGGTTIHSWSGLGIRDAVQESDKKWLKENDRLIKRYNSVDILIIDEVSMLHGARLDMLNQVCKWLRDDDAPFGGLQVIMTGDLFQLPPIGPQDTAIDFVHLSQAWQELQPKVCYLREQHRQGDDMLKDILDAMRANEVSQVHFDALSERLGREIPEDVIVTKLYSHNQDVEQINDTHLAALRDDARVFVMEKSGTAAKIEQLQKSVLAPEVLELKIGAEVMFVANNFAEGFVNGSRGRVIDFQDGAPVVALQQNGRHITVTPHSWVLDEDGKQRAKVSQLPLRLAWAITIHKSQGMSLDSAEIDLSRAFTPGMGYVALSRVRSLDGIYLRGINNTALMMHPDIFTFDAQIQEASLALAAQTSEEVPEEIVQNNQSEERNAENEALLAVLRTWRDMEAKKRRIPLYMVAGNKTLEALAVHKPKTTAQLLAISGVGPKMIEKYGDELLIMIREHLGEAPMQNAGGKGALAQDFLASKGILLSDNDAQLLVELLESSN